MVNPKAADELTSGSKMFDCRLFSFLQDASFTIALD